MVNGPTGVSIVRISRLRTPGPPFSFAYNAPKSSISEGLMKTFFRVVGVILLAVVALIAIGLSWLTLRKPAQREAPVVQIDRSPEVVARGKYLVNHVTICFDC